MTPDEIDCTNETSVCLDLDVASTHVDALDAYGVTLSHFVGNDSFKRRPIVLTWHRNRLATTNGVTLAFNIPIASSHSTCANFVTVD